MDENFDFHLAEVLAEKAGAEVVHVRDSLFVSVEDERIKSFAASEGYIIVTQDLDFWGAVEGFSVLVLRGELCHMRGPVLADWLLQHWAGIEEAFTQAEHPAVGRVYSSGTIRFLGSSTDDRE
ncbi:MAG: DUF5615 family PIN-like protein [Armatimonadota bacterium]